MQADRLLEISKSIRYDRRISIILQSGGIKNRMDIIGTFAELVGKELKEDPDRARKLLLLGYRAKAVADRVIPEKHNPRSKQLAAQAVMDVIIRALAHPEQSAMVSLFVPGEPLSAAGITPYSVEALSCYLTGTRCEKLFLNLTAEEGIPETMCSFHRIFLGAAESGLMPKPRFTIYTNLACDGNMMTFPYLKRKYGIPGFFIDVPYEKNPEAVDYVAGQLREMTAFLSDMTGKKLTEEILKETVLRSNRSAVNYREHLKYQKNHHLPGTLTGDMYGVFMSHILLGTRQTEKYTELLLKDIRKTPESTGLRIMWIHLMPFMQKSVKDLFNYSDRAYITSCDLVYDGFRVQKSEDPYEAMADRMVRSAFNGNTQDRIDRALEMAEETEAEGVVIFTHWGCKTTIGASGLMKDAFEEAGMPAMILDGDGCNPENSSDGQIATRLEAFLEMLTERRNASGNNGRKIII